MRGDEIAGGKDVADENPRLDFTLPDDVFSSGQPCNAGLNPGGLTLPSQFQSVAAGLGPDGDETCFLLIASSPPSEDGGARRVRTDDLMLAKHALYQLSYGPVLRETLSGELADRRHRSGLVGPGRLELPTLRLSGVRSNHLSYGPSAARRPDHPVYRVTLGARDRSPLRPRIGRRRSGGKEKRRRRHPAVCSVK